MTGPRDVADHERHADEERHGERVREEELRGVKRLEAFSDGVFAIAITLVVLTLEVPPPTAGEEQIEQILAAQWPQFASFALSFWVVGRYWVAHHSMFAYIRRYDSTFLTINLLVLFAVAFLPFPTEIVGQSIELVPVLFYAATISVLSLASSLLWWYASHDRRLVEPGLSSELIRAVQIRALSSAGVFLLSIPVALVEPSAAIVVWVAFFPLLRLGIRRRERRAQARLNTTAPGDVSG